MQLTETHRRYWQKNLNITAVLMAIWFVVTFVVSFFARDLNFTFFGWPFSFWVGAQGALVVYVLIIGYYAWYMNKADMVDDEEILELVEMEVRDLLKQYHAMKAVMKTMGSAPGLLSRLPGIKNLMNLRKLQGKGMEDVLGADAAAMDAARGRAASYRLRWRWWNRLMTVQASKCAIKVT